MQSIKEIFKLGFGPSSSHTIGPGRAAEMFLAKNLEASSFRVTLFGSLAATGVGHQTDVALQKNMEGRTLEVVWNPKVSLPLHPNGMLFEALQHDGTVTDSWEVYSIGGGDLKDANGIVNEQHIYPLSKMTDIMKWCKTEGKSFWEYVENYEGPEIWDYLKEVKDVMFASIKDGLESEGVLPGPIKLQRKASSSYAKALSSHNPQKSIGLLFAYALAVSEENAAGNRIAIAPTCGSAGVVPSVLYYASTTHEYVSETKVLRALATAGLFGNVVKTNASISGAEVGCQGEIGTACAMAAAALTQMLGGSIRQIEYAAEMGFEHNLGLTCDPVLGFVQIPCIERNAVGAGKAYQVSTYAMFSDGGHKISYDQVVETMAETGRDLQSAYRETGYGGLAKKWEAFK
ncbi:MAG TPA: L-serine ammonia-lyase [Williamwhitmania sp.]|nr:L-serine ammonia-lyase [Williamwhitmania sp.]